MKKKKSRHFFRVLFVLAVIFTALYIAMESGYYESKLGRKVELTNEKIAEFEQDIKDGKEIDIHDYISEDTKDYNSKVSKLGMNISNGTEKFMTKGINEVFRFIGKLFS